ncbi:MAG TPA: Rne/Rng family ribonuclease, partial [Nocardioides sp.]|nr:Rne/Rng family ribonuclease [Nocardioides sp.]
MLEEHQSTESSSDDTLTGLAGGSDPAAASPEDASPAAPAKKAAARKTTAKKATAKKTTTRKTAASVPVESPAEAAPEAALEVTEAAAPAKKAAARKTAAKKATAKKTTTKKAAVADEPAPDAPAAAQAPAVAAAAAPATGTALLFKAPEPTAAPARRTRKAAQAPAEVTPDEEAATEETPAAKAPRKAAAKRTPAKKRVEAESADEDETTAAAPAEARTGDREDESTESRDDDRDDSAEGDEGEGGGGRRRRRRGGRRRRKSGEGDSDSGESNESDADAGGADQESGRQGGNRQSGNRQGGGNRQSGNNKQGDRQGADAEADADADEGGEGTSRRRRRRRRSGDDGPEGSDDPQNTVTRVRKTRSAEDEITSISGSTRLEAKKQRRRDGREAGRRRAPIVSEAEFLARRESVERVMVIRQRDDLTQIAVIEDKVLVEHYVARESQTSIIGNVYLGRVQNVLPSMEAAFIDIGKGRNAVLYAGEVNWSALGHKDGQPRKIESVLSSGQSVLVQVTKDPIGHKGARLTSQVSLAGRFLVYVPDGTTSGISRKLPDTERNRLKTLLKEIVPDTAGVIVRTAAEGASEDELTRDVERLKARWEDIEAKVKGSAPQLLYGEPDLTLKVVRDLFTEDFGKLVIEGADAWDTVQGYVRHVAPDLEERLERFEPTGDGKDVFATYRVDEQIAKGLDRKVWLPSGGSLVIDRTEAMTVVDVNTGKFTGSGGNLEETVTKNNLEAAEEIVRQLRLRDIGGIIVVDF